MGEIHAHEFMSADGVVESPSWTFEYGFDPTMGEAIGALTQRSEGILLGRVTYEMFGPAWSGRTAEDDPGAPFFNDTTKYVVSSTLENPDWGPAEVLAYDAVRELKDRLDGDLYISGSAKLVRALLADGLLDGLHLFVFPLTLGSGLRLFQDGDAPAKLALAGSDTYPNGVVYLNYASAGA
jgi:dihydrofolate reductase